MLRHFGRKADTPLSFGARRRFGQGCCPEGEGEQIVCFGRENVSPESMFLTVSMEPGAGEASCRYSSPFALHRNMAPFTRYSCQHDVVDFPKRILVDRGEPR